MIHVLTKLAYYQELCAYSHTHTVYIDTISHDVGKIKALYFLIKIPRRVLIDLFFALIRLISVLYIHILC